MRFVVLLRGINVGGRHQVPMPGLRALAADLGWRDAQTYVQSGNLVCTAASAPELMEEELEAALAGRFGFSIPVLVRDAEQWATYVAGNPFSDTSGTEPNRVMLALSKASPSPDTLARLRERATGAERVERVGDAIWIHYAAGFARSRLTPGSMDRVAGSAVTTRNWRTVLALARLCAAP